MNRLQDKVAIVTGGASGIGRAICERFAAEGARVAILDLQADACTETCEACPGSRAWSCDVSNSDAVRTAFDEVADAFGPIDIVVNNAAVSHIGTVENTSAEDFERIFRINVQGVFHGLREAVRHLKPHGGCILNMGSVASEVGLPDRFAYTMSKGAVTAMTRSVARDCLEAGIRCNAIAPARVHTPFVDDYLARHYPGKEAEQFARLSATQPIGRMGRPEEVAALAAYLCSDEASFITGSVLPLDGGYLDLKQT